MKNEDGSFTADANGNVEATTVNASGLTVTDEDGNTNFQVLANGDVTAHDITANNVEADVVKGNTVVGGTLKNEDGSFTADANGNVEATTVNASGLTVTDEDGNTNFQVLANGTTKINNVVIGNKDSSAINVGNGKFVVYDGGSFQAAGRNFIVNQQGEMTAPKATIDKVVIDNNEVTGLKNTAWTPNTVDYSNSDKAATEAQLSAMKTDIENNDYDNWNISANGGTGVAVENSDTVDFSSAKNADSGSNVTIEQNAETGSLTFDLADKVVLGENDKKVTIDAKQGNIAVGNGVSMNANGQATFGTIKFNNESASSTITGLTNTTWNQDGTYTAGRAATEEQLHSAIGDVKTDIENSDYDGWNVSANGEQETSVANGKTVDFSGAEYEQGKSNITVTKTDDGNGNTKLKFDLADDLSFNSITTTNQYVTNVDGNNENSVVNVEYFKDNEKHIATENEAGYPEGGYSVDTTNDTVTLTEVDGSGSPTGESIVIEDVASAAELDGVNTKVTQNTADITTNKTSIENLKNTVDAGWTAKVGETEIEVKPGANELTFAGDGNVNVMAADKTITVGLADTITIGSSGGTNHPITINGTTGEISGLINTEWKPNEITYDGSNKAATEGQLKDVYDAIGDAQDTTYTEGNGINIGQDNKISVQAADGGNVEVTTAGVDLKDDINLTSVTASSAINVGSAGTQVKIDGATGKITGLTNTDWGDGHTVVKNQAATEGQLQQAVTDINDSAYKGWNVSVEGGTGVAVSSNGTVDFSNNDNNIVIGQTGTNLTFDLADSLTGLTSVTVKTNDSDNIVIGNGKITGLTETVNDDYDAANKKYVDDKISGIKVTGTGYTEGDGIDITAGAEGAASTIAVDLADTNSNLTFDNGGLKLADNISVTGTLDVTRKATFKAGADMNGQQITNVGNATTTTDAVNYGQLQTVENKIKTYTPGNGIDITGSDTTTPTISVKAGDGITFDTAEGKEGQLKVALKEDETNLVVDNTGLSLSKDLTGLENVSSKKVIVGADHGVTGITIDGKKITGLDTDSIKDDEDAVNKEYVDAYFNTDKKDAVQYDDDTKKTVTLEGTGGTEIKGLADARWEANSNSAASVGLVYDKAGEVQWRNANYLENNMDLTEATEALDSAIGTNRYTGKNVLDENTDGKTYSSITDTIKIIDNVIGPMQFKSTNFLRNQSTLSGGIDKLDSSLSDALGAIGVQTTNVENDDGTVDTVVSTRINWNKFNYISSGTIVDGIRILDGQIYNLNNNVSTLNTNYDDLDTRVTTLEGLHQNDLGGNGVTGQALAKTATTFAAMSNSQISTLSAISNMDMSTANTLASISPNALKAVANLSAENTVISDSEPATDSTTNSVPSRKPENGNTGITTTKDAVTVDRNVTVNGDTTLNGDLNVRDNVSVGGTFEVDGKATFNNDVSIDGTLNMNNNVITGVADGKVSADSTEAINGSQLYAVEQKVDSNTAAINTVGNQVNRLSNRIDKVGAGAAALAALHPLDFDPDDKLSFAAGYGNYAGENAVAVGAFYQPNEDTMFSVGGTFGNDENMVNAGVSFKLGQKSNVSRSRVSMAKELVALRDEVAQLKALMAHAGVLPADAQVDTSALFPDVPQNHWAYECVHELGRLGILEGYADGNFEGDRMMTRYEMAAIVYRAMQKGVNIDSRMLKEFEPELKLIRVDVVARDDDGNPTIERVRVNEDVQQA